MIFLFYFDEVEKYSSILTLIKFMDILIEIITGFSFNKKWRKFDFNVNNIRRKECNCKETKKSLWNMFSYICMHFCPFIWVRKKNLKIWRKTFWSKSLVAAVNLFRGEATHIIIDHNKEQVEFLHFVFNHKENPTNNVSWVF